MNHSPRYIARREFLTRAGGGIGGLALLSLLSQDHARAQDTTIENRNALRAPEIDNPLAPRPPHFPAKAKHIISLFMFGGISHVDTFDPKVTLDKQDGVSVSGRPGFDTMG